MSQGVSTTSWNQQILNSCEQLNQIESALNHHFASTQFLAETKKKVSFCYAAYLEILAQIPVENALDVLDAHVLFSKKHECVTLKISTLVLHQEILNSCKLLDQLEWALDDQLKDHPVSTQFLEKIDQTALACNQEYLKTIYPKIPPGSDRGLFCANLHFLQKYEHLTFRILALAPVEPVISYQEFVEKPPFKPPVFLPQATEGMSAAESLTLISSLLREERSDEALGMLWVLPITLQKDVFDALHVVRGCPSLEDSIGHENFGEISFKNKEPRCASSPQQKACAVELVNLFTVFLNLISLLKEKGSDSFKEAFFLLPGHIQNEIFRKHWELMGGPTFSHPQEALRKIAHYDFGRVSLLGLEARCDVSTDYKVRTLEAYLVDFRQKIMAAQVLVRSMREEWDKMEVFGEKKDSIKKKNLQDLAKAIVPVFEGSVKEIELEGSYHALGTAYVKAHPCLRPFFLQLMNYLEM